MGDIEIRKATAEDTEAIIGIGEVYEGMDYLEDYFDECFIDNPMATPYVALHDGDIVGFVAAFLVDDGATVVSRGGRMKAELSRRGFYKKLKHHCLTSSKASVNAFTAVNTNIAVNTSSFLKDNTRILTRALTRYNFSIDEVRYFEDDTLGDTLTALTPPLLESFMTTPTYKKYLFPQDRAVIDWVPYRLLPSNIPIIWKRDTRSLRLSDVKRVGHSVEGLMSNAATYRSPSELCVCILDIYGTDVASVRRHLLSHVRFVCKQATERVTMMVFTDQDMCPSVPESVFKEMGLVKMEWFSSTDPTAAFTTQCLFEKKLEG